MRLPAFPTPVPGETVHSVVSRFMRRTAGTATRKLETLALRKGAPDALLPRRLDALAAAMPVGHSWCNNPEAIVSHHSLVPLYLHFADRTRAKEAKAQLASGSSGNPSATLGITVAAGSASGPIHKFCPACVQEDREKRGFSVGYREHQPEFVRVCARHGVGLLYGCTRCPANRRAARRWTMVGECSCETPTFGEVVTSGESNLVARGWRWMSEQAAAILSTTSAPERPLLPILREAFLARGLLGGSGVNARIRDALVERFGEDLLVQVGAISRRQRNAPAWMARLLGEHNGQRACVPNVLRALLLTGLVADGVTELACTNWARPATPTRTPQGYSQTGTLTRPVLDAQTIRSSIEAAKNNLFRAAEALSVSPSVLAVDMRRQGVGLALSKSFVERIGSDTLERVWSALRAGETKKSIQEKYKISEWSLQLIELDQLGLASEHRAAAIESTRQMHRDEVLRHIRRKPVDGRMAVARACPGAVDWLRRFDAEWLREKVARKAPAPGIKRARRRPWDKQDEVFAARIEKAAIEELGKSTRPVRLTASLLRRVAGVRASASSKLLPLTFAAAKQRAEEVRDFECRKIKWALGEYKTLQRPLSMNLFRRLVSMEPKRLKRHSRLIADQAMKHGIAVDGRCALA